jgi:hypothetical protein
MHFYLTCEHTYRAARINAERRLHNGPQRFDPDVKRQQNDGNQCLVKCEWERL